MAAVIATLIAAPDVRGLAHPQRGVSKNAHAFSASPGVKTAEFRQKGLELLFRFVSLALRFVTLGLGFLAQNRSRIVALVTFCDVAASTAKAAEADRGQGLPRVLRRLAHKAVMRAQLAGGIGIGRVPRQRQGLTAAAAPIDLALVA